MTDLINEHNDDIEDDAMEVESIAVTPIVRLNEFANSNNIVELLSKDKLQEISQTVIEQYEEDRDSMSDWGEILDEVKELNKVEIASKSEPWEGAANFKSTLIKDAVNRFGDRCSLEILTKQQLCKPQVIGADPTGEKLRRGQRVCTMQNFELRYNMPNWIEDQDRLHYQIAEDGSVFKKTYYDPMLGQNVSEIIKYPNFAINQSAESLKDAPFSIINQYTEREILSKQRAGIWAEFEPMLDEEGPTEEAVDSDDAFIEQHTFLDLDEDGYPEPYIVTVYYKTRQVVRILARYEVADIIVKSGGAVLPLSQMQYPDLNAEIVEINPEQQITHYGFIPATTGFLHIGYGHLLMAYGAGMNKATNSLLNAGELANLQGGYLAKGVRKKMGVDRFKPGQFASTNIDPQDLKNAILPFNFKEPSATLLSMREMIRSEAQESSSSVDLSQALGNNTPAATALSVLQEQLMASSSIISRIYRSMTEEFRKLYRLTGKYGDPRLYVEVIGEPANLMQDFSQREFDIIPVGDPQLSSKMQRIMQSQAVVEQYDRVKESGGNTQNLIKNYLQEIGMEDDQINSIFPQPMPHMIEQQNQLLQQQNAIAAQQNELQSRLVATEEQKNMLQQQKNELQAIKQRDEAAKMRLEIEKLRAETVLTYEKAESEDVKNQVSIFNAQIEAIDRQMQVLDSLLRGENEQN